MSLNVDNSVKEDTSNMRLKKISKGRVFRCTGYPDCNMSFTRSEHLARHKRKHTGERPFTCHHCSKNFSRLDNLRQHVQTVHAYESYLNKDDKPVIPTSTTPTTNVPPTSASAPPSYRQQISPPNSSSPYHSHPPVYNGYPYPYGYVGQQYPQHDLKVPVFSPKNRKRPTPLALQNTLGEYHSYPPLKTAPASQSFPIPAIRALSHGPKSASLTPNLVSPLSPLFHQSFNQTNKAPLPLVQNLPRPYKDENTEEKSLTNEKRDWLRGVLNQPGDTVSTITVSANLSIPLTSSGSNDKSSESSSKSPSVPSDSNQTLYISKKPTINSLLSPYDDEKFPDDVKN